MGLRTCATSRMLSVGLLLLAVLWLSGCGRNFQADSFAHDHGFSANLFLGDIFDMQGYLRGEGDVLRVYIEGDGLAWLSRKRPSSDPTPHEATAFVLAAADTSTAVLYLARPCQFVEGENLRNCATSFWTSARFSEQVVADMSLALDQAKVMAGARELELVGYSGGGAVAVLLAARRSDVRAIVTAAGNLDHRFWTAFHGVSPLRHSLNPADVAEQVQGIRQVHIVSRDDSIIPPAEVRSYVDRMSDTSMVRIREIRGIDHDGDWSGAVAAALRDVEQSW
ncbi:alpha/beta fold hydrolase [Pseudodesulfovibrio sediminis]|uniref:Alpha/beta hydrolase n=1 Tax=Pseudodesulfovibrio sediminis TaxID=2810563 RepID=A0ABN6EVC0_9BACT|nr:hypothetical protein [Pseudodesulfovibrio sediminis]BCS89482.1 alpha/beta hydrolase [Pseudodesulfovibrio sediminis]